MARKIPQDSVKLDDVIIEGQNGEYTVAEIKHSTRIQKSVTPKGTLDWYIKWASSVVVLFAITLRATGIPELQIYDMILSWVGAVGWFVVGFLWKDRALTMLNAAIAIMLFAGIINFYYKSY